MKNPIICLEQAIERNKIDKAIYYIEQLKDINCSPKNSEFKTYLQMAAYYGRLHIVLYLLGKGIDASIQDNFGRTAEGIALVNNYRMIARRINDYVYNKRDNV